VVVPVLQSVPPEPAVSDVASLLRAYDRALAVTHNVPASVRLPVWPLGRRVNRALHRAVRPDLGAQHWVARHIRHSLGALDRGIARRAAVVGLDAGADDEADRKRLSDFRASLPPPVPRVALVVFVIAQLVLTQALLTGLPRALDERLGERLMKGMTHLGPSPDPTSIRDVIDGLLHANRIEVLIFVTAVCWSAYCLLRLPAGGYRLAMLALGQEGKPTRLRRRSDLFAATRELNTQACELRAFESLGVQPPAILPVDLVTKALFWAPILLLTAGGLKYSLDSPWADRSGGIVAVCVLAAVILARLAYLHRVGRKRHVAMGWLWKGAALVVLVGLIVPLEPSALA
jgi:hypothetical protein